MSVNGIGYGYSMAGYTARKQEKNADTETVEFLETIAEKVAQDKAIDHDEQAFEMVGPHAPQKVKDAWMEAAKEVYANGAGIQKNGMMSHISQMMVQRCNKMLRGEADIYLVTMSRGLSEKRDNSLQEAFVGRYQKAPQFF